MVPDLGGHDAYAPAGRDEGRGDRAAGNLVGHDGLQQRRPEGGGGRVLRVPGDCAQAVDELLRIPLGEDRVELAAVRVGNPEDDAGRVEEIRRAVEQRRQRARVDHAREVDAERRDAREVCGRRSGERSGRRCLHGRLICCRRNLGWCERGQCRFRGLHARRHAHDVVTLVQVTDRWLRLVELGGSSNTN